MKQLTLILSITFLLYSCDNRIIPLRGSYSDVTSINLDISKAVAWPKLINAITLKGLAITTLDEKTGVVATENAAFVKNYTWENSDGTFTNPYAWVVCNKYRGPFTLPPSLDARSITGQWTFLLKQEQSGSTLEIRLVNARGEIEGEILTVKSTGEFEKSIETALR